MGDRSTGLHQKYVVERTDGKPIEHGCIVLEWDDPNARVGIRAFAEAVREDGYLSLADDLDRVLASWEPVSNESVLDG